jgi:sialate O-acetylesterase
LGFAIAGEDRVWAKADARIVGSRVAVKSDRVEHPVAVRYAWADNPACNLYNAEKLPAGPFRTDEWEP